MFSRLMARKMPLALWAILAGASALATDYTWTGSAGDGKWSSPDNWSTSAGGGYPSSLTEDTATFAEGTTATVCFDQTVSFKTLLVSAPNIHVTFTSAANVSVTCNVNAGSGVAADLAESLITLDGVTMTSRWPGIEPNQGVNMRLMGGTQLTAQEGYNISTKGYRPITETRLEVLDGSVLTIPSGKTLALGGEGTLILSNATAKIANLDANGGNTTANGGGRIRFLGESPRLEVSGRVGSWNGLATVRIGADFDFVVPEGGYAQPPFVYTGTEPMFNATMTSSGNCSTNRFNISSESPLLAGTTYGTWALVLCTATSIAFPERIDFSVGRSTRSESWTLSSESPGSITYTRINPAKTLVVTAEPYEVGTGDYGIRPDLEPGSTVTIAAPTPPDDSGLEIEGYRLYTVAADGTETEVEGSPFAGTTCAYVHGTVGRKLVWLWKQPTVYVSPTGADSNGGTSPDDALASVQAAIDKYAYGKVIVAPGRYASSDAIVVGNGVTVVGAGEKPSDVVLVGTKRTTLFYAKNVIVLESALAQVRNVRLTYEKAEFGGAGVKMSAGRLSNCEVVDCCSSRIVNEAASTDFANGISMTGGLVENCLIADNRNVAAPNLSGHLIGGGGVWMSGGVLRNCLIRGNLQNQQGTGVFAAAGTVENCTIVENGSTESTCTGFGVYLGASLGSGAWNTLYRPVVFRNNIVRGNVNGSGEANVGGTFQSWPSGNCTQPAIASGTKNINVDPQFDDNFGLGVSDCVNGGVYAPWMEGAVDLNGQPRVHGSAPDIGCYEFAKSGLQIIIR